MIAGLPKAPSLFNPITNVSRALERRNYILQRMHALGFIDEQMLKQASLEPTSAQIQKKPIELSAPFIAEMVRQKIIDRYGEDAYSSGMVVYTTITRPLQQAANQALRNTLHSYDERHGYRFSEQLKLNGTTDFKSLPVIGDSLPATLTALTPDKATARLQNDSSIDLAWDNCKWARKFLSRNALGPRPKGFTDILKAGDIIRVRQANDQSWRLAQIPEVEGAFVALDPNDGAILALTGGYDFFNSKFNRATQSNRQPGSGFKPIIYTTALENGYTAASMINDAPLVIDSPVKGNEWRPENYSRKFYGPTSLRTALRKSRNLISIRLLRQLGLGEVIRTALRFGFTPEQLPKSPSLALGSGQATPLQMARVFAVFANGGFLIEPYFIERIESSEGQILFQAKPARACNACPQDNAGAAAEQAPRIISPQVNFLMNSLLRDVVQRGTATKAKVLGRQDLAGKTGTTNDQRDAWFNGFTPIIAATAWVGFDDFSPLGNKETGGAAALPLWIEFMREALKNTPEAPFEPPADIVKTWIATNSDASGYWEYFDTTIPARQSLENIEIYSHPKPGSHADKKPVEMLF
jgi:penicillin-binding protein 1A